MDALEPTVAICKQISPDVYVGNITAAKSAKLLSDLKINAIINLSGETYPGAPSIDTFDYLLPSQELLITEQPKTIAKLETIAGDIQTLRNHKKTILIHCFDGKNKCVLAAGYYFIVKCGWNYNSTISQLETLYFTPEQNAEETEDKKRIAAESDPDRPLPIISAEEHARITKSRNERREVRCLTMNSFQRVLRMAGGAKK